MKDDIPVPVDKELAEKKRRAEDILLEKEIEAIQRDLDLPTSPQSHNDSHNTAEK